MEIDPCNEFLDEKRLFARDFFDTTHGFYKSAKDQIDVLVEMHKNMTTMYKELVEYFCLDTKKTSLEEFFGDIKTFLDCFEVNENGHFAG